MLRVVGTFFVVILAGTPAFAQNEVAPSTSAEANQVTSGYLDQQIFTLTPQAGIISYSTPLAGNEIRGTFGIGMDWNMANVFGSPSRLYIGPQTGLFFAHTGSPDANFVGTNATTVDAFAEAGYLWIPLDLKIGYSLFDNFRLSVHGGGNIVYRSISGTVNVGNATTSSSESAENSSWNIFPNVGGDIEIGLGRNLSILVRPDVTIASGTSPFTATAGLGIGLA